MLTSLYILSCGVLLYVTSRARKKVLSGSPGQVDILVGQVTFEAHLTNAQGSKQVIL